VATERRSRGVVSIVRIFRSEAGRLRLPWRLTAFLAGTVAMGSVIGPLGPDGLVWGSTVLLVSATCSGWILLALDGRRSAALGFHASSEALAETGKGLALGMTLGLTAVVLMAAAGGLRWAPEAGRPLSWLSGGAAALALRAVPAAAEEALLRGYPLQALGEVCGGGLAIVVTGLLFGLLHLTNPGAGILSTFNVGAAGILLGVIYVRTLSLWWATGAHLGWNWAHGGLLDLPVSGIDLIDVPGVTATIAGEPGWWTGGSFGPEGSVLGTVVLLVGTVWAVRNARLRPSDPVLEARPLAEIGAVGT